MYLYISISICISISIYICIYIYIDIHIDIDICWVYGFVDVLLNKLSTLKPFRTWDVPLVVISGCYPSRGRI